MKKRISLKDILDLNIGAGEYQEALGAYGFNNPKVVVDCIRSMVGDESSYQYFSAFFPVFFEEISLSPDPDMVIVNFERFVSAAFSKIALFSTLAKDPHCVHLLVKLFGTSKFLSDALIRNPEYFEWLTDSSLLNVIKDAAVLKEEIQGAVFLFGSMESRLNTLRRFKRREMLRIGIKDIVGNSRLEETVYELSALADAALDTAYLMVKEDLEKKYGVPKITSPDGTAKNAEFAVISMGKLGGEELNYSSDIDVMFVYSDEGETDTAGLPKTKSISNSEFFTKMGEAIIHIIGSKTKEGYVFRIDTRLRPEGKSGPLVRSLESYQEYYGSWGAAWERMALIKARFSAGDAGLGKSFMEMIRPFVYQKSLSQSSIDEIKDIKKRIEREVTKKGRTFSEVKLGYGGIREIEFTVQVIQLISGGKNTAVQSNNTINAINAICGAGIFSADEAIRLIDAYRFLRRVEHFLQIEHELQLHHLPSGSAEINKLAKKLGYSDGTSAGERFMEDYKSYADFVHGVHNKVFTEGEAQESPSHELDFLYKKEADEEAKEFFIKAGFRDVNKALSNLKFLVEGPAYMHVAPSTVKIFKNFASELFEDIKKSPDPDMAFNNFERFVATQGARSVFYKMLDENRRLIKLLVDLGGNSQFLSDIIAADPEILEGALTGEGLQRGRSPADYHKELAEKIKNVMDYNERLNVLRKYRKGEIVRIGLRDILKIVDLRETLSGLSNLADALLMTSFEAAKKILAVEYGSPIVEGKKTEAQFAIIGMGKLGGGELGYSSDLDIIFVYSGEGKTSGKRGITNQEYFAKLSEKIIGIISKSTEEGFLYRVDTRIRPGGKSDVIVLSLDGYRNYYGLRSMTWEKQSLTKSRFICGDAALGEEFRELVDGYLYRDPLSGAETEEIRKMRARMETERVKEAEKGVHIKLGAGGIVDVEFIVQVMQMCFGAGDPELRGTNTLDVLSLLKQKGRIGEKEFTTLHDGYIFLRRIENKLRIVSDLSLDALPKEEEKLKILVKRLGMEEDVKRFLEEYRAYTEKIREIFNRIVK